MARHDSLQQGRMVLDSFAYGLSQLGYVLIFSGIFAGTFNVFRLSGRTRVILIGVTVLAIGLVLLNRGPIFGI